VVSLRDMKPRVFVHLTLGEQSFNSVASIFLVQAGISDGRYTVEEEKALRTCEELLTARRRAKMLAHYHVTLEQGKGGGRNEILTS
jgi:hypothetical protein